MDPLEREIADAVNVDPSPEFVARVRARVASVPVVPRTRRWPIVVAAGLAATLAVAIYVQGPDRDRTVVTAPVAVVQPATRVPALASVERVEQRSASVVRHRAGTVHKVQDLEVIVAADEVRGWRALDDVRRSRATLVFDDGAVRELQMPRVTSIVVAPIQIAPIELASTSTEGEGQ